MHVRGLAAASALLLSSASLLACGADQGAAACSPVERPRAQFPAGHIFPGQPEPVYLTEPPTSGPHVVVATPPRSSSGALSRPVQVGLLEAGLVLVQYRPEAVDRARVDALARQLGPGAVVAPNPDLPDPVVASAWLRLQRCERLDPEALARFVAEHADEAPGPHGDG